VKVAYFAHELADPAVRKRVRMLEAGGCTVSVLGFERVRGAPPAPEATGHILGHTRNRRMFARIGAMVLAIPRALKAKPLWRDADFFVARNLEMLILVTLLTRLVKPNARIIYECLDIHRLMLSPGIVGAVIRAAERACLSDSALVVTSSPAFERNHFRGTQHFQGEIVLVENKVLALTPVAPPPPFAPGPPWVIAWCGVLRCRRSFEALRDLAGASGGRVLVQLWGTPALDQIPDFHDVVAATPGMTFRGRYAPDQLADIYAASHFAWAIDFYEAGGNSDWLLPNRLYESLAFGAAPIVLAGNETAHWLGAHRVGEVLDAPIEESLGPFLDRLTPDRFQSLRDAVIQLDPNLTRFTPAACRALAERLAGAAHD
jgi:hypothetical protein